MAEAIEESNAPEAKPKSQASENLVEDLYFGVAERTVQESSWHGDSLLKPYNPDDLWRKTGDYSIYEDMLNDDQVSVCQQLKKDLVIGAGWDIEQGEDDQDDIAEDVKIALTEDSETPFDDCLEEIISAYDYGFSLTEKVFKHRPDGGLTLKFLKTRHPSTWLIHTDEHGNIEKYEQMGAKENLDIEPRSLIHYVNSRKFQNPYGKSDLRKAYNAWFIKRQVTRFYAMFLEGHAGPKPIAKYDKGVPQARVNDIFNVIKKFQAKTAMAIPKDIELDLIESKSSGEAYEKAMNIFNMFIGRGLFVPDLLGLHGAQTSGGSLALGKEQMNVFIKHIQRRRKALEDLVNNEIIWPIVFYNHGYVDNYPKFKLKPISDTDAIEFAKLWLEAVRGKTYKPSDEEINHFRAIVKFPTGPVEHHEPLALPGAGLPGQLGGENEPEKTPSKDEKAKPEKANEKPDKEPADAGAKAFKFEKPPGDYHKKCDFKAIKGQLDAYDDSVRRDAAPVLGVIFEDLYDQIQRKKIVSSGKVEKVESIKLRGLGNLKKVLKKSLREIYIEGKGTAQSELFKGKFALPMAEDEFLELLEKELYNFIGDWEYQVVKSARQEIIAAIKDGRPVSSVIKVLGEDLYKDAQVSVGRYARTKHTEVLNKGRLAFFEESGVVAAYQYSAILDDHTSDICRGLDGKVFPAGSQPVPPMHFNCRSLLIPITKFEQWEADKKVGSKNIEDFIEENKGKGFPTQ